MDRHRARFEPVPRVSRLTGTEFRRFERARRPVVIAGAIDTWPALTKWSAEMLRERFAERLVRVRASRRGAPLRHRGDPRESFEYLPMTLDEALREIVDPAPDRRLQIAHLDLNRDLPELGNDVRTPAYCPRMFVSPPLAWISGPGGVTPMHWDPNMAFIAEIMGKKRFVLGSPGESAWISRPVERHVWRTSGFDPVAASDVEYPRWWRARLLECTLTPGDLLFVPYRFWHYASTEEPSISVNFWWEPGPVHRLYDVCEGRIRSGVQAMFRRWRP